MLLELPPVLHRTQLAPAMAAAAAWVWMWMWMVTAATFVHRSEAAQSRLKLMRCGRGQIMSLRFSRICSECMSLLADLCLAARVDMRIVCVKRYIHQS